MVKEIIDKIEYAENEISTLYNLGIDIDEIEYLLKQRIIERLDSS